MREIAASIKLAREERLLPEHRCCIAHGACSDIMGVFQFPPTSTVSRDGREGGRGDLGNGAVSHRVDCCVYFIGGASIRKKNLASSDGVLLSWSCVFMTVESERGKQKKEEKKGIIPRCCCFSFTVPENRHTMSRFWQQENTRKRMGRANSIPFYGCTVSPKPPPTTHQHHHQQQQQRQVTQCGAVSTNT